MNKLVLVRHGQSMGNAWEGAYADDDMNFLTPMGIAQAEVAGWKLQYTGLKFANMVSSTLTRARQTMAIMAHVTGDWQRRFVLDRRFDERDMNPVYNAEQKKHVEYLHIQDVTEAYNETVLPLLDEGNVLLVTHHYTMEVLFPILGIEMPMLLVDGNMEPRIPNAVPYVLDMSTRELIVIDDFNKTPRIVV